jgi:SAM-dependent methyltransferase
MEHIHDHDPFFKECYRILKKDGLLIFSRPNILSLKSRLQFLFTGFYYSFKPLDHHNTDGLQHIASLTVDQYNYLAFINGLEPYRSSFDKRQSTSRLLSFLIPFLWVVSKIKSVHYSIHNRYDLLTARILFYA